MCFYVGDEGMAYLSPLVPRSLPPLPVDQPPPSDLCFQGCADYQGMWVVGGLTSILGPVEEIAMSAPTKKWMLGHHAVVFQSNFLLSAPRQCDLRRTVTFCDGSQAHSVCC